MIWAIVSFLIGGLIAYVVIASLDAAYHNGVVDGYGYAVEPFNPGYLSAGNYLKKHMSHRFLFLEEEKIINNLREKHRKLYTGPGK